jgi:hypothetical protein
VKESSDRAPAQELHAERVKIDKFFAELKRGDVYNG